MRLDLYYDDTIRSVFVIKCINNDLDIQIQMSILVDTEVLELNKNTGFL